MEKKLSSLRGLDLTQEMLNLEFLTFNKHYN
jgi:hypothetical protein